MSSYKQIQDQIKQLQKQAEELRKKEIGEAINSIKRIMAEYNITLADLGGNPRKRTRAKGSVKPIYKDPISGKTWSGRGRSPKWFDKNHKEKFLIK